MLIGAGAAGLAGLVSTRSSGKNVDSRASLPGNYRSSGSTYPQVLTNPERMRALLTVKSPIVALALHRLENNTRAILSARSVLAPPYSGCDFREYLRRFSVGPEGAAPRIHSLATYAYLASLAPHRFDSHLGDAAAAGAVAAIASWSKTGFRHDGRIMAHAADYCSEQGLQSGVKGAVGLQIGRGMIPFVNAIDLLQGRGAIPSNELPELQEFLRNQLGVVLESANVHASQPLDCGRFDNQASTHLWAIMVLARYLDDAATIEAVAGHVSHTPLKLSWPSQLAGAVYGENDRPRACYANPDPAYYFQMDTTAPGELDDRFRGKPFQPFGYTLGSLVALIASAEILENAGFAALAYHGPKGQSLRLALDYYAFYLKTFLSFDAVSLPKSGIRYPDFAQYAGQPFTRGMGATVEDKDYLLTPFLLGHAAYPDDGQISGVIQKACSFASTLPFNGIDLLFVDRLAAVTCT